MAGREQPYDPYIPSGNAGSTQHQGGDGRTAALQAVSILQPLQLIYSTAISMVKYGLAHSGNFEMSRDREGEPGFAVEMFSTVPPQVFDNWTFSVNISQRFQAPWRMGIRTFAGHALDHNLCFCDDDLTKIANCFASLRKSTKPSAS